MRTGGHWAAIMLLGGLVGAVADIQVAPLGAGDQPERLDNPGFEEGMTGWSVWVARQPAQADVITDEQAGSVLHLLGEEGSRCVVSQGVAVPPQRWYRVRYRYRAEPNGAGGGSMGYCRITLYDQNGRFLDYPNTLPLLDSFGSWEQAAQVVRTPLSVGELRVEFNQSGPADLRIDDVSIEPIAPPLPPPNTWHELTRARAEPLAFSSWQYTNAARHFRQMGLKYGWRYRYLEQFDELRESHTSPMWQGDEVIEELGRHGVQPTVYLYWGAKQYRDAHYGGTPPADLPYMIDPVWHDGYVHACREACVRWGRWPGIAYIFVQDESWNRYAQAIGPQAERTCDLWRRIDAEVRREFGGGRFGLPAGPDDDNACRWIAYYRWAGRQWAQTFARLRRVIDESGCGAKLLGPDEVGILMPLPWAELAQSVDVFTGQCLCSRGSAREYMAGFTTKYTRDLTGKPVHNATQIVKYSGSPPPEEVQRQYSLVLQSGGEGQMLIGVEWFDRELNHHQYSAPARWATIKRLLHLMATHEVRTPERSTVALLYSSPSGMAQGPSFSSDELLTLYAILGPRLGAWPTFIDTAALAAGRVSLDGFDLAVWATGSYETPQAFARLRVFVEHGGTLICCDPLALRHDTLGEPLPTQELLGALASEIDRQRMAHTAWPIASRQRVFAAGCYALEPLGAQTAVAATWPDGSAAALRHRLGAGQVITWGGSPVAGLVASEDEQWLAWWQAVLAEHGVEMDLPIWRLRLPDEALVYDRPPEDVCITGNNFMRVQNGVYLGANDAVPGRYRMSPPPDLSPESGGAGAVRFDRGDLTDRAVATRGPFDESGMATEPHREQDWANRWSAAAMAQGLRIEFTLLRPRELSRVRLWFSGALPALRVEGLSAGRWRTLARARAWSVGPDVEELELPLDGRYARVRLCFAPSRAELAVADIELWARR
ncbi:MAG: hypothetical protein AB7Y46_02100 [Armatimonadota bacterium]